MCRSSRRQAKSSIWPNRARGGEARGLRNKGAEARGTGHSHLRRLGETGAVKDRIGRLPDNVIGGQGVVVVVHHEDRQLGSRGGGPPLRRGRGVVEDDWVPRRTRQLLLEGRGRGEGFAEVLRGGGGGGAVRALTGGGRGSECGEVVVVVVEDVDDGDLGGRHGDLGVRRRRTGNFDFGF